MNKKIKAISEGAMYLALLSIVLMLDRYSGGMFELLFFLVSIPIIIYTLKYEVRMAITLAIAIFLVSFMFATPTALFYLISAVVMGILYGYGLYKKYANGVLLSLVVLGNVIVTYMSVFVWSSIFGFDLEADMRLMSQLFNGVDTIIDVNQIIWTSIVFVNMMMAIMQGVVVHLAAHQVLKRMHLPYRELKKPMDMIFPRWCGIACVLVYALYFLCVLWQVDSGLMNIVMGAYCCVLLLTVWDGIMCIMYYEYRRKYQVSKGKLFLLILLAIVPLIQNIFSIIGIIDMIVAYRKQGKRV